MAKIVIMYKRTIKISFRILKVLKRDCSIFFSDLILDSERKGLRTLKILKGLRFKVLVINCRVLVKMIRKSRRFQLDFK